MKLVIADDHAIVRRGLQQIISSRHGWIVAAEASDASQLLTVLRGGQFDVLVLDVSFDGRSGIDVIGTVRAAYPRLGILMLSMFPEEQYAVRCIRAGALGFVQKNAEPATIIEAIEKVAAGHLFVSTEVLQQMASELVRGSSAVLHERLSKREFEVFRLIASGMPINQIAEALNLSAKTVSTYRARILEKMSLRSNADIVAYAVRKKMV
ncbi:MAG TPA: response regulator transcription factor [Thermoanaerobaculia bacterium]|nr:response regulator transcription factor [Thermoanaerobaculia bacterium]